MKKFYAITVLILILGVFVACGSDEPTAEVRVAAMRGPTAMGLLQLMDAHEQGAVDGIYEFELLGSPDLVPPLFATDEVDVAAVPGNMGAILYNRMDVRALAVVTLGVLYIVDTSDTIHSVADLAGRTIYLHGQGATPEFALNYVLRQNGLEPGVDVFLEYRAEHTEIVALMGQGEAEIALLPEPFLSNAMAANENIRIALDLTEEWDRVQPDYSLIMSVVVARREFLEENEDAIRLLMQEYEASVRYINTNVSSAAQMAVEAGLVPNAAAGETAIPRSNIVWLTGEEMRQNLLGFYNVLYQAEPASVGGAIPSNDFFFIP